MSLMIDRLAACDDVGILDASAVDLSILLVDVGELGR